MLLPALKLQLAALITVAGINTDDISNPALKKALGDIDAAQKSVAVAQKKVADAKDTDERAKAVTSGNEVVQSATKLANELPEKVKDLASKGDKDALYAQAVLTRQNVYGQVTAEELLRIYRSAADKGHVSAQAELGEILLTNFSNEEAKVTEGRKNIESAEKGGSASARRILANLYLSGAGGVKQDATEAVKLLDKGSKAKDGSATYSLSQVYAAGLPAAKIEANADKALELLKAAAIDQENQVAMNALAARYFQGDKDDKPVKRDPQAAIDMFQKAADKGNSVALRSLAQLNEAGVEDAEKKVLLKRDLAQALKLYQQAAAANDPVALQWLGDASLVGLRDPNSPDKALLAQDPKTALDLYRIAAQNNLPAALYKVAMYYETGNVVDRDLQKAFALHQRAATAGVPAAMLKTAQYYQQGAGVGRDPIAAFGWFKVAADAGVAEAQNIMGSIYLNGGVVPQDLGAAAKYYELAAGAGVPDAMLSLARLHSAELPASAGVAKNYPKAWRYVKTVSNAVNKSLEEAEKNKAPVNEQAKTLKENLGKFIAELEGKMSASEKEDAQRMLKDAEAGK
jgi:uncharacterized protein